MCGICGFVDTQGGGVQFEQALRRMCRTLFHRGPDDEGYYLSERAGLAMRRLSIIDLAHGQQPVTNEDGTLWLVFNGEIYNFRELRERLEQAGHIFKSHSDTEVIIHAYEEYGRSCVEHFNGMFALAIWNSRDHSLFLARDRLGIKPLYYWRGRGGLVFGSTLTAVALHPDVPREINLRAVDTYLTFEYIPAPETILEGVRKLPAAHWLYYREGRCELRPYWEVKPGAVPATPEACVEALRELIQDAVRLRLISDVPLGAFLSGGLDSSTIVAAMHAAAPASLRTFSIGFHNQTYNELPYARSVAARFETRHREEILQPDINDLIETVLPHLDEPLADFSVFPTYLVSKVAAREVKVALSGDGGDELFGGYDTYLADDLERRYYRRLPAAMRTRLLPAVMGRIPPGSAKKGLINRAKRFIEGGALPAGWQHTRWMMFMTAADKNALYRQDFSEALGAHRAEGFIEAFFAEAADLDPLAQQQVVDIKSYLVDNILVKVDRMSMAASLEARVPFLDHRLVEFALGLPAELKLSRGETKVILRRAVRDLLPEDVLRKPKQGFSIPLKHWLRGPLRPLLEDLLSPAAVRGRGYFETVAVQRWKEEHLGQRANHSHRLWALMLLEMWQQRLERLSAG